MEFWVVSVNNGTHTHTYVVVKRCDKKGGCYNGRRGGRKGKLIIDGESNNIKVFSFKWSFGKI